MGCKQAGARIRDFRRRMEPTVQPTAVVQAGQPRAGEAPPHIRIAPQRASSVLLSEWRAQLSHHNAAEPVWLPRRLLDPGTIVGDTLALFRSEIDFFSNVAGVELWAQRRPVSSPMHLHWDCDEDAGRRTHELHCPQQSAILYVSSCGGPTLVVEHRPGDAWCDTVRCHLSWPHAGQITIIPGNWLHGVLAVDETPPVIDAGAAGAAPACAEERVTLVLNTWSSKPEGVPALQASDVPTSDACAHTGGDDLPPSVLTRDWDDAHSMQSGQVGGDSSSWQSRMLTVGMFDGSSTLELCMPDVVYRGFNLESFTATVKATPKAMSKPRKRKR